MASKDPNKFNKRGFPLVFVTYCLAPTLPLDFAFCLIGKITVTLFRFFFLGGGPYYGVLKIIFLRPLL